jgi:hypothetical protein
VNIGDKQEFVIKEIDVPDKLESNYKLKIRESYFPYSQYNFFSANSIDSIDLSFSDNNLFIL